MLRRLPLALLCALFLVFSASAQNSQGTLRGKIIDKETGEGLPFVNVVVEQNGISKYGGTSDFDGKYDIKPMTPGKYDVKVSYVGYGNQKISGVVVTGGKITFTDLKLSSSVEELDEFEVIEYTVPLIDKDGGASGGTVTRDDISKMPGRSAASIATTVGGVASDANGNITSIRGARSDANFFYIDGIKVRGSSALPKSAIEQVTVITGGLPANYGDATGGIISITTRGPSSKYFGGIEALSSGFKVGDNVVGLDRYGFNLIEGSVSGPLLFKKDSAGNKTEPIIGFFASGNFTSQQDPRPLALGSYRVKDEVRAELLAAPLSPSGSGSGFNYNSDFLRLSDLEKTPFRKNVASTSATLAAKFDVNTAANTTLTFGGSLAYGRGRGYSYFGSLLNEENYGLNTSLDWRVYGKFTQRFNNNAAGDEEAANSTIKNAFYTVQVDYQKNIRRSEDATHGDNLFNYGYVGKFETSRQNSYAPVVNEFGNVIGFNHDAFDETLVVFTPSDLNSELAAITNQVFNIRHEEGDVFENFDEIQQAQGLLNGEAPASVYGIWGNVGARSNGYSNFDQSQFRITAAGSADIGNHAVSIGFEFEQLDQRSFNIAPAGLWRQMRLMANSHIAELDFSSPTTFTVGTLVFTDYDRLVGNSQFEFDRSLRVALGLDPRGTDFIDVDALDPDFFSLDFFSADDLLNSGQSFVNYYGFDHTGKKLTSNPSFDDFFTAQDENGNFTRPVAPFQPIYVAGYIMDKFAFDDIIFNVGVRVDRFDANQQVLKDPFLLFEARTVGEVSTVGGNAVSHPAGIPNDAVVYVNDLTDPTAINGYRVEDTWFNADGVEISDPSILETANGIAPLLVDPSQTTPNSSAFKDYEPQVTVMPRISFSFPISDEALFFAHYDILSKRPTTGNRLNPFDYFFIETQNGQINNPNLRPEKTIDYELGFQQVLSKASSLKISAFYRELRDMVQSVAINQAYPRTYTTFGNLDFGTVKGMTVSYDLRKTGNLWMRAAYTLSFAEGTGSTASTGLSLVNTGQPNLRTINPFSYDQRHQITATVDYRYGEGKDYNGPVWFGKQIFANTGVNFQSNLASGTPYSAQSNITPEGTSSGSTALQGQINGSRQPWQFRVNAQIDRNFVLKFGKNEESQKTANLNVYFLINNLFNTLNVTNVYRATGNPDDDGFLAAATFQESINQQNDPQAFRELYALKVNSPFNFGLPRTIRLGVKFDF